MNRMLSMTIASLKMTFRSRQALFWSLMFPVILLGLLSLALGQGNTLSITVGVVGTGPVADTARQTLSEIDGVKVKSGTEQAEQQALRDGHRDAVLIIPPGVPTPGKPLTIKEYYDKTNLSQSSAVLSLINQVVTGLDQHYTQAPTALLLQAEGSKATNTSYINFLAPGIIAMSLMTSGIIGISSRMVGYRERRILKRIRATPMNAWEFIVANVISQIVFVLAQVLVLSLVATLILGVEITGNWLLVIALASIGGLAFLTIGFAVSGFAKTTESASALGNIITMPMMFLSGIYFPISGAPEWLQKVIGLLPLTYLANGLRDVMLHGAAISTLYLDFAALAITVLIGIGIASRSFRWE